MTAAKKHQFVTVTEYLDGELHSEVKHEYTGGYVYAMAGASSTHNAIAVAFVSSMYNALRGQRCQAFNSDMKVRVQRPTHSRFYYPDGMVVCDPNRPKDMFQDRPIVLAEVISESTRRIDEGEKKDAYLAIPELSAYLLIESSSPHVSVYHRVENGFAIHHYDGIDAVVPLPAIQAQLPLRELYERVDFTAMIEPAADPE